MYDHVDYFYNKTTIRFTGVEADNVYYDNNPYNPYASGNEYTKHEYQYEFKQHRTKIIGSGKLLWIPISNDLDENNSLLFKQTFKIDDKIEFEPSAYYYFDAYSTSFNSRLYYTTADKWIEFTKSIEVTYTGNYGTFRGDNKDNYEYTFWEDEKIDSNDSLFKNYNKTVGKYLVYWND